MNSKSYTIISPNNTQISVQPWKNWIWKWWKNLAGNPSNPSQLTQIHVETHPKSPNNKQIIMQPWKNWILGPCTPMKGARRIPKGLRKTQQSSLRQLLNTAKAGSEGIVGTRHEKAWFLKDVLNEINVLGSPENPRKRPRNSQKSPQGHLKGALETTIKMFETGTAQKAFWAPEALWEVPAFETWTLESGPQIYIDIQKESLWGGGWRQIFRFGCELYLLL